MFSVGIRLVMAAQKSVKHFSTSIQKNYKVAVIGGASAVGQQLCLWLKFNPLVSCLAICDEVPITPGVAVDISHIDSYSCVTGHKGFEDMVCAIKFAHVVVILDCKHQNIRGDAFETNACVVKNISNVVANESPEAMLAIVASPINSMVPLASEVLKKAGVYDQNRIFGVTTVDGVRARTLIGDYNGVDSKKVFIPVVGGASAITMIPMFSQCEPPITFCNTSDFEWLLNKIRYADAEVAAAGGDSGKLCTSYAIASFVNSILRALNGEMVFEFSYVRSPATTASYFINPLILGKNGIEQILSPGTPSYCEMYLFGLVTSELIKDIEAGRKYVMCRD